MEFLTGQNFSMKHVNALKYEEKKKKERKNTTQNCLRGKVDGLLFVLGRVVPITCFGYGPFT
jgi:hypothetical protein